MLQDGRLMRRPALSCSTPQPVQRAAHRWPCKLGRASSTMRERMFVENGSGVRTMYGLRAYAFSGTAVVGCATGLRHAGCARCVILLQSSPCCDSWQRQVVHLWSPCWSPFGCMLLQSSVRAELCQCRFWSFAVRSLFSYMPSKFWRTGSSLGCMFHAPLAVLPEGALNVHPFC